MERYGRLAYEPTICIRTLRGIENTDGRGVHSVDEQITGIAGVPFVILVSH